MADKASQHPLLQSLPSLPDGLALWRVNLAASRWIYIRGNRFDRQAMRPVPSTASDPDNGLAPQAWHTDNTLLNASLTATGSSFQADKHHRLRRRPHARSNVDTIWRLRR